MEQSRGKLAQGQVTYSRRRSGAPGALGMAAAPSGPWQPARLQSCTRPSVLASAQPPLRSILSPRSSLSQGLEGLQEAELNRQAALFSRRGECIFPPGKTSFKILALFPNPAVKDWLAR